MGDPATTGGDGSGTAASGLPSASGRTTASDNVALVVAKNANLAVAFALELAVLVAVGMWAYGLPALAGRTLAKVGASAGAVIVMATVWGLFGAPSATVSLHGAVRIVFVLAWFGVGALAFAGTGRIVVAAIFYLIYLVSLVLASIWHQ